MYAPKKHLLNRLAPIQHLRLLIPILKSNNECLCQQTMSQIFNYWFPGDNFVYMACRRGSIVVFNNFPSLHGI